MAGAPGSGKTTYALDLISKDSNYVRVNRDDIRKMVSDKYVVDDKLEKSLINDVQHATILSALKAGKNVIVDNTNARMAYIKEIIAKYYDLAEFKVKYLHTDLDELLKRNELREKKVPIEVIHRMYKSVQDSVIENLSNIDAYVTELRNQKPVEPPVRDPNLPDCIIVDIDGTVAKMGDRSPFDWKKVGVDTPNENVCQLVCELESTGSYEIIFLSGRDEVCRAETLEWLDHNVIRSEEISGLYMRPKNDYRKDSIVKKELYEKYIKGKYNVCFVLDDRDQVVEFWRKGLGLTCLQVDYGNF